MLIRSQNKKRLVDAIEIYVDTDVVTLKKERTVKARYARQPAFFDNSVELGKYPNEETAVNEVDNIMQFFIDNPSGVYQMK